MSETNEPDGGARAVLDVAGLDALLGALRRRGYRVLGPTLGDGAIVYGDIAGVADLPKGWTDEQAPGSYRLKRRDDDALFGYVVGPHSWKQFLFPPTERLASVARRGADLAFAAPEARPDKLALIGVRACELKAIAVQDRVFLGDRYVDPHYRARREGLFVVAVNCGQAGGLCFCVSMACGPQAKDGFDLALTEIAATDGQGFVVEAGSPAGASLLAELPHRPAQAGEVAAADAAVARAAAQMGRSLDTEGLRDLLMNNLDHPRWSDVAERCLSCGNCTMVCPTCFCSAVEDASELDGAAATRTRRWDSCFALDHSHLHGGSVRATAKSRYRQWMTHKLATWIDQFGTSGCVGCGRCIAWCPVGIDITEEARAIRDGSA